jgi:enamine deaminase RidA (YjgF/YER057c/UK114 family)
MTRISPLYYLCILPGAGISPVAEMRESLDQLKATINDSEDEHQKLLKLTVFLKAQNNSEFYATKADLHSELENFFPENTPAVSFVAQPPEQGRHVSLEATMLNGSNQKLAVFYKGLGDIAYTLVQYPGHREIYAAGLTIGNVSGEILAQSQGAFDILSKILQAENMDFSNIVRQWNYVEDIVCRRNEEEGERQNYQVFNDVRTTFYAQSDFRHGYPSATGIGAKAGGIVLECMALDAEDHLNIVPLSNPQQQDAHRYSQDVLVGIPIASVALKTSPKFERAKLVSDNNSGLIYVSGTASIRGQKTVGIGDVAAQTQTTIENIAELTSKQNLENTGFQAESEADPFSYLRVYVKHTSDIPQVKNICEKAYGKVPALYVVSDICRDELLVEIEGAVHYPSLKRL